MQCRVAVRENSDVTVARITSGHRNARARCAERAEQSLGMPRQGALTHINRRRIRRPDSRTFKSLAELRAQVITGFGTGIAAGAAPFLIAAGPDGDLRLIEAADRIVRITPLGVIT